jgi:cysteine-rich repeat protein
VGGSTSSIDTCSQCATGYGPTGSPTPDTWVEVWGDSIRVGSEIWDDGNTSNGDGWSGDCLTVEANYICTGGSISSIDTCTACSAGFIPSGSPTPDTWVEVCGDGLRVGNEICDDGNTVDGDGCSMDCLTVESNYIWVGGSSSSSDSWSQCSTGYQPSGSPTPNTWVAIWGDGLRVIDEICDDSNTANGDGCSSNCLTVEPNYIWVGGSISSADTCSQWSIGYTPSGSPTPDTCIENWGDGLRYGAELCDDGNASSGDGCSSDCRTVESNYICVGGTTSSIDTCTQCGAGFIATGSPTPDTWVEVWGDGLRVGVEIWDDGNTNNADGCSNNWLSVETNYICTGGSSSSIDTCTQWATGYEPSGSPTPDTWVEICGDGLRNGSELCDDGNTADGDGCSGDWRTVESNYIWVGGSPSSLDTCSQCTTGYGPSGSPTPNIWIETWGDGLRYGAELWDDGNASSGDGWSNDCRTVESNYIWVGGSTTTSDTCSQWATGYGPTGSPTPDTWVEIWGDGLRVGVEIWDDGNTNNADGCSSDCLSVEANYIWTGGSSSSIDTCSQCTTGYEPFGSPTPNTCIEIWGDGLRYGAELCDDANTADGDGCSSDWRIVETNYIWVGGSTSSSDTWSECTTGYEPSGSPTPDTWVEICGDGLRYGAELCDDGNVSDGDGCSSNWRTVESNYIWVGGSTTSADTCSVCSTGYEPSGSPTPYVWVEIWGDGLRYGNELWDDGNQIDNDGCSSDCMTVEFNYIWVGGSNTSIDSWSRCTTGFQPNAKATPDECVPIWGDGRNIGENWDDGNLENGDGWDQNCNIEENWMCIGGNFTNPDLWFICTDGFSNKDSYLQWLSTGLTRTGDIMRIIAMIAAITGIWISILAAFMSIPTWQSSSFGMINQLQMIIILPLIGTFIPGKVMDFLKAMSDSLIALEFLPSNDSTFVDRIDEKLEVDQSNLYLYLLELQSGSALVNMMNLLFVIFQVVFIHVSVFALFHLFKYLIKVSYLKNVFGKVLTSLSFGFYIVLFLETYLLLIIVVLSEISDNEGDTTNSEVSLRFSHGLLALLILFNGLVTWQWVKCFWPGEFKNLKYFKIMFDGLKDNQWWRIFPVMFLIKRGMFSFIVLIFAEWSFEIKMSLFIVIQILYFSALIYLRPFESMVDNFIEMMNNSFYIVYIIIIWIYQSEEDWRATAVDCFFILLIVNNVIIVLITNSKREI